MNTQPSIAPSKLIWANRNMFPAASRIQVALAAIVCVLCSVGLPMCLWSGIPDTAANWLGIGLLVLLSAYVIFVARFPLLTVILLGTAYFAVSLLGFTGGAAVLVLTVGIAAGALLMTATCRPYLLLACHVAAFAVVFAITRVPAFALLSFLTLPASLFMAISTVKGGSRTSIVCAATAGLALSFVGLIVFLIYEQTGSLKSDVLVPYINSLRDSALTALQSIRDEAIATAGEQSADAAKALSEMYGDDMLKSLIAGVFNLIPALIIAICMVLAYEAQILLLALHNAAKMPFVNTVNVIRLRISVPAAIIFTVSFVLTLVLPDGEMASAVAQNLAVILLLPFCLVAVRQLFTAMRGGSFGRLALPLILGFALCCCSYGSFYFLALYGAYCTCRQAIDEAARRKMNPDQRVSEEELDRFMEAVRAATPEDLEQFRRFAAVVKKESANDAGLLSVNDLCQRVLERLDREHAETVNDERTEQTEDRDGKQE